MDFLMAMLPYINIGFFGAIAARFTGVNLSVLVLCSVLYLGATPVQAVGMLLTFLSFMLLTRHTQNTRLTWKNLRIFHSWRILIPVLFVVLTISTNPFYAIASFIGFFLMEVMAYLYAELPADDKITKRQWITWTAAGTLAGIVGLLLLQFIPATWYYLIAGTVILAVCAFAYVAGRHRARFRTYWDAVLYGNWVLLGAFGLELSDWISDLQRTKNTALMRYLPLVTVPVVFLVFVASHVIYGTLTLSGLILAVAATVGVRLFGMYEVSGRGGFNLVAIAMAVLTVLSLFLVQPAPTGVTDLLYMDLPFSFPWSN